MRALSAGAQSSGAVHADATPYTFRGLVHACRTNPMRRIPILLMNVQPDALSAFFPSPHSFGETAADTPLMR